MRDLGDALGAIQHWIAQLARSEALAADDGRALEALARIASDAAARALDPAGDAPSPTTSGQRRPQ